MISVSLSLRDLKTLIELMMNHSESSVENSILFDVLDSAAIQLDDIDVHQEVS